MNCDDAALRLPWMINGTIDAAEREHLEAHLAGCAECRQELEDTRQAGAVFSAHLPTSVVMDIAWDRPNILDPGLVKRHLEHCVQCSEDLSLARESRHLESMPEMAARPRPRAWRTWTTVPASLAAGLAVGFWWASTPVPSLPMDDGRVRSLESEVARLQESERAARAELDTARRPEINLPVSELFAADEARRSPGREVNQVVVPAEAAQMVFVFGGGRTTPTPATVEIRDTRGKTVWSGEGLRPGPLAAYALSIPRALLPDGDYVLVVRPAAGSETTYRIRVRAQR